MTSEATVPPERELTEALLSLSWPLPRTVGDAQSALDRLDQVRLVLSRLEQESVGTEAWWAGQVDALGTQSGFVLEWWLPVLRDPDLDWTLNHQAHLTADLATLASAGARLLDQLEPSADRREELARVGRRGGAPRRDWGPAAVPHPVVPGARPQPPAEVFGGPAAAPAAPAPPAPAPAVDAGPGDGPDAGTLPSIPVFDPASAARPGAAARSEAPGSELREADARESDVPRSDVPRPDMPRNRPSSAEELEAPAFPPMPGTPDTAASDPLGAARHRRPSYDFDDPSAPPPPPPPAVFPPRAAPGTAGAPGTPGTAGAPRGPRGPRPPRAAFPGPPPGYAPVGLPPGFVPPGAGRRDEDDEDDEDEQGRVVPTALRRHQRRLLLQSALILAAVGGLCWWAVSSLTDDRSPASAAGSAGSTAAAAPGTGAAGLTVPGSPSATAGGGSPGGEPSGLPPSAPATATSKVPDATTATSVQTTLLGGSGAVPQIVALVTVHTAGTGAISVTASYYGQRGETRLAPESQTWTLTGRTVYQFTVPIANSSYCGGTFHFTLEGGGRSSSAATSPGC